MGKLYGLYSSVRTLNGVHNDGLSDPDQRFAQCNDNKMNNKMNRFNEFYMDNSTSHGDACKNSSDCTTEKGVLRFCNHDYDLWGYCEECTDVISTYKELWPNYQLCVDEGFHCERGENSCIETCEGN